MSLAPMNDEEVWTVALLDARLRGAVRALGRVVVEGEISGAKRSPNGHLYFNLVDEREEACVACVMWRSDALKSNGADRVIDGARVQLRAIADVYAKNGRLQLQVSKVVPTGLGDLLLRREELKRRLDAEGLFDPARKKRVPESPRVIGVVTSGNGAAFADIVKVARRRGNVRILLASAPVQGPDAPHLLRRALSLVAQVREVDVIIVGRGGGSAEDLAAFDDESLVRAIAACKKPVVAAVGHEIDWSIACMVADVRAATPSQAAELLVPDDAARRDRLEQARRRLGAVMRARLQSCAAELSRARARLRSPDRVIADQKYRNEQLLARVVTAMRRRLDRHRALLGTAAEKLDAISPLAVLSRGYAIALVDRENGQKSALRDAREAKVGDALDVRLHAGSVEATITAVHPTKDR
jgi:exodeoxyribonuclease VII large subunit